VSIATIASCGPFRVTPRLCGLVDARWTSRGSLARVSADAHDRGVRGMCLQGRRAA
jgi:hypothetical protein